jgi:hypothetical protein
MMNLWDTNLKFCTISALVTVGTDQIHLQYISTPSTACLILIYLLSAVGLTPSGSSTVHVYIQTIHRTTQSTTLVGKLSGIRIQSGQTNWEECGSCPVFVSYTLAFASQLRKKHGETSVRVAEKCQLAWWKQNIQNRTYITIRIYKQNNKNTWFTKLNKCTQNTQLYI